MKIQYFLMWFKERAEGPKAHSTGEPPGYNSVFCKGDKFAPIKNPGRCPGLGVSATSLRPVTVGSGRMGKTRVN